MISHIWHITAKFMKIRLLTTLSALICFTALAQLATNVTVTNLQGRVYKDITLDHTNSLGIVWKAQDGSIGQIKYTDLAMEYWDKFNLSDNAKNAMESITRKQEQERQARARLEEEARQQAELLDKQNRDEQNLLSATNSEEKMVDALEAKPADMSPEEKTARDGILKALLDISSATSVGVSRNNYGDLLAKAASALAFGKTKLPTERHKKYLICAEKALGFYDKANDEWSDYFKNDWQREREEALMSSYDFYNLRRNGLMVDASSFRKADRHIYYVSFKKCLTLYWQAADIYVQKMQKDAQQ